MVGTLMRRARDKAGRLDDRARLMEPELGELKARSTLSSYMTGTTMPGADVLLAAMKVTGVSVDEELFGQSLLVRQDRLEAELADLRRQVEQR